MSADELVLTIVQGKTFRRRFEWYEPDSDGEADLDAPFDLTGFDAHFAIRRAGVAEPVIDYVGTPGLIITVDEGAVDVVIVDTDTEAFDWGQASSARWELELNSTSEPHPEWGSLRGAVRLVREVAIDA